MPTLALHDTPQHPHDWHRVAAPGGYEWWRFDAEDAGRELRVTVDLFDGDPFDPGYRAAYRRYRRRPTRVAPPVPRDYPRVRLVTAERGRTLRDDDLRLPPGSFTAAAPTPGVAAGAWALTGAEGGGIEVSIRDHAVVAAAGPQRDVRLTFTPREPGPPELRRFEAGERSAADYWLVSRAAAYDVSGAVGGQPFTGHGRFDHFYGSGPMGEELRAVVARLGLP